MTSTLAPSLNSFASSQYSGQDKSFLRYAHLLNVGPEQQNFITRHGEEIVDRAQKLGLNPRTLTAQERSELGYWGRILTDKERKEQEEYTVRIDEKNKKLDELKGRVVIHGGKFEVVPRHADKAYLQQMEWYRSRAPAEKIQFLHDAILEMRRDNRFDTETTGGKFAKFVALLFDFLMELFSAEDEKAAAGIDTPKRAWAPAS